MWQLNYRIFSEDSQYKIVIFSEHKKERKVSMSINIFNNIYKKATEKNISINALEEKAGVSKGSIYKWDSVSPTIKNLSKVANVLECSADDLIKG